MHHHSSHNEKELLARVVSGNEAAMKILFHQFYPRLCFLASEILSDDALSEDMAQEALSAFWQRRGNFSRASMKEVSAFLFTVVRNRCFNHLKHLKIKDARHQELLENSALFENFVEARIVKEDLFYRIYQEILLLPESQRQVLKMIFVDGLETSEIADRLGTTANNIRNQKARALEKLKPLLQKKRILQVSICFFYDFL